ncbi:hypothetical protein [uncultured Psychroserpens sp.]|uniref:hypothetical protein n=1 Tax=uncultured Psychroserpens sp. TaxID=255436 RepID=UPI0026072B34|nr:hypothetical protein [uncultured Psychroserpens sp.]
MKALNYTFSLLAFFIFMSCSNAQKQNIEGKKVTPNSPEIKTGFFEPFTVDGVINIETKKGKTSVFRYVNKQMNFDLLNNQKVIKQVLSYFDNKKKLTGVHTTIYDPTTFHVLYWRYDNKTNNSSFAFKTEGTTIKGTQDVSLPDNEWKGIDIGTKVFQNESRELFFRAVNVPIGTVVSFPIIGMQSPFHGWVNYKYSKNRKVLFEGKSYDAKIWEAANDSNTFYVVIDKAPYVIKREVSTGKEKHVFSYRDVKN